MSPTSEHDQMIFGIGSERQRSKDLAILKKLIALHETPTETDYQRGLIAGLKEAIFHVGQTATKSMVTISNEMQWKD